MGFKFLALSNFVKEEQELVANRDKWMYILKNMSKLDKMPAIFNQKIFKKIFQISEVSKLTKEDFMEYEASLKARWDYENALSYTEQTAREEERAIAAAEKAKALAEERAKTLAAVRELKKVGVSVTDIAKTTGLSESEVEEA